MVPLYFWRLSILLREYGMRCARIACVTTNYRYRKWWCVEIQFPIILISPICNLRVLKDHISSLERTLRKKWWEHSRIFLQKHGLFFFFFPTDKSFLIGRGSLKNAALHWAKDSGCLLLGLKWDKCVVCLNSYFGPR